MPVSKIQRFPNNSEQSVKDLSIADQELYYAIQLSKAIEESRKSFVRDYSEQSKKLQNKQQD